MNVSTPPPTWKFTEELSGDGVWQEAGAMGDDDLRPSAESGLSLLYLDVREKCDLKGGNVETFELECSSLSWLREVSPQRVRPNRLGSQRGRLSFPEFFSLRGVQEFEEGKPSDPCTAACGLWKGGQAASGSEHPSRGLLRSLPGSVHQRDRHFQRNSHPSGGTRPAPGE